MYLFCEIFTQLLERKKDPLKRRKKLTLTSPLSQSERQPNPSFLQSDTDPMKSVESLSISTKPLNSTLNSTISTFEPQPSIMLQPIRKSQKPFFEPLALFWLVFS